MPEQAASLHHVGIVVTSIEASLASVASLLGLQAITPVVHDPVQRVRVVLLAPVQPGGPQVELVEPAAPDSPVSAFLARGGGSHHTCYEVDDLDAALAQVKPPNGLVLRRPQPAVLFDGRRIAWVQTRDGALIELLERARRSGQEPPLVG